MRRPSPSFVIVSPSLTFPARTDLSLAPYAAAVRESLILCKDRVGVSSPQGSYLVSRYVYRAALHLLAGQMIGDVAGAGGAGPGGIEVVHPDWAGHIVVETEGTTEAATLLLARVRLPLSLELPSLPFLVPAS